MQQLEVEIKELIISTLHLEDVSVADINSEEPLFVEGLGLDSIDALELGVAIKKKYNIHLKSDDEETQKVFSSVRSLATYIEQHQTGDEEANVL